MATSSSAKKVAKLASRGKGKKVRFSGGTTFPAVIGAVCLAMVALIVYSKGRVPGEETGAPQPGTDWAAAYSIRVCNEEFILDGTPAETTKDASTGNPETLKTADQDGDGIIHYHPQTGGATGRKAKLGVFLDIYGVKLSNTKLEVPADQIGDPLKPNVWDTKKDPFKGTECEGKTPVIKVRVWNDATSGEFVDNVVDFRNLRIDRNGMAFVIAVVPDENDYEINRPASACDLDTYGAIGTGNLCGSGADTTVPDTTVPGTDTTVAGTDTTVAASTTTAAATTTTTG